MSGRKKLQRLESGDDRDPGGSVEGVTAAASRENRSQVLARPSLCRDELKKDLHNVIGSRGW